MQQHKIKVERNAHYHSIGTLNNTTQELWIVCHGYGQLAEFFLKKFKGIETDQRYIVAPEGFNKFYLKGYNGRVGASWMTKHQREDEIEDHCNFLESITNTLLKQAAPNCKLTVLGFSQGAATVSRWLLKTNHSIYRLIIWGGRLANDFHFENYKELQPQTRNYVVFGSEDEFYSKEDVQNYQKDLENFEAKWINYKGGHSVDEETLQNFILKE